MIRRPTGPAGIVENFAAASSGHLLEERAIGADLAELGRIRRDPTGFAADGCPVLEILRDLRHVRTGVGSSHARLIAPWPGG
jgi:hypothetical protein